MTPDQRAAALRLARYVEVGAVQAPTGAEIAALLRELAAEPVQEPVAWRVKLGIPESGMRHIYAENPHALAYMQAPLEPLYTPAR